MEKITRVNGGGFGDMLNDHLQEAKRLHDEEEAKFAKMSASEQALYIAEKKAEQEEVNKLLSELGKDPGFMHLTIGKGE